MLLSTFVLPAARADQSVFVSGPDLTVTLPDELNYVLRDLPEDDPVWELFETDRESLLSLLAERNIYLYAFPEDLSFELDIVVTQSDGMEQFFDYNLYEDEELLDVFSSMGEEMLNENEIAFYDRSIYQSGEPKFIHLRFDHELDGLHAHSCTYTTAYNGIGVSISLHSFEGTYTRDQDALLQSVVDSVRFQEKLSPSGATFAQQDAAAAAKAAFDPKSMVIDAVLGGLAGGGIYLVIHGVQKKSAKRIGDDVKQ